jgi:hypothetical protein
MGFTEAEAKAQVGKQVRVRDASLWQKPVAQGTLGRVVGARRLPREEAEGQEGGWGVCIEVFLSQDHSLTLLLRDIGKAQYEGAVEEIAAALSPQDPDGPEGKRGGGLMLAYSRHK